MRLQREPLEDGRKGTRAWPANALSETERERIMALLNSYEYRYLNPNRIVPRLADEGIYLASESTLFRTLKYRPEYPQRPFADCDQARHWVGAFVDCYNGQHRHSGLRFVTPNERHSGQDHEILTRRHAVYQQANQRHLDRWSGQTRNLSSVAEVVLNKTKPDNQEMKNAA